MPNAIREFSRNLGLGVAALAFITAAPAAGYAVATLVTLDQKEAPTPADEGAAQALAAQIQNAIDSMRGATQCELEAEIQRILRQSGASAATELRALSIVAANEDCSFVVLDALINVDLFQPEGDAGYSPDSGFENSCTNPVEAPPTITPEPAPEPELVPEPEPDPEPVVEDTPPPVYIPPPPDPSATVGDEIVAAIQDAPRYTTQCEFEHIVRVILENTGFQASGQNNALGYTRQVGSGTIAALRALDSLGSHMPVDTGYTTSTGRGRAEINLCNRREPPTGVGYRITPPAPPPGGGNSDY